MKLLVRIAALVLLPLLAAAQGQDSPSRFLRLDTRAIATGSGADIIIDRGTSDRLELGDSVVFYPRSGGVQRGKVARLEERSAIVRLDDPSVSLAAGVRGEILIPTARFEPAPDEAPEEPEPPSADEPEPRAPEHPPWESANDGWTPDKPLLAEVKAVRPQDRKMQVSGRFYLYGDGTYTTENGRSDSFLRAGTDVDFLNPFGRGGELNVDAEWNYRTTNLPDQNDESEFIDRLDRLSYVQGGNRFDANRREVGRFLQYGMPEFGVLDGYESGRRNADGEYSGWSVGFLPEPDKDQQTGEDAQIAFTRHWVFRDIEGVTADTGYQKTFHKGKSDRDLLVAKIVRLPRNGWDFYGTAWVDFYSSRDDLKGSGAELTQLHLSTNHHYEDGSGVGFTYSSFRFPELRRKEFLQPNAADLADDETQRLWIDAWKPTSASTRVSGRVGTWRDEDETGGDAETSLEVANLGADRSLATFTLYGTNGKFSDALGIRFAYSLATANGSWDLLTEASRRRQDNFTGSIQDLPLYRLRLSRAFRMGEAWYANVYAEAESWQEESAGSVGFTMQRDF